MRVSDKGYFTWTVIDTLVAVVELIENHYDPSVYIADQYGNDVRPGSSDAVRFSIAGAVRHISVTRANSGKEDDAASSTMNALAEHLLLMNLGQCVTIWESNPWMTKGHAVVFLNSAIERLRSRKNGVSKELQIVNG